MALINSTCLLLPEIPSGNTLPYLSARPLGNDPWGLNLRQQIRNSGLFGDYIVVLHLSNVSTAQGSVSRSETPDHLSPSRINFSQLQQFPICHQAPNHEVLVCTRRFLQHGEVMGLKTGFATKFSSSASCSASHAQLLHANSDRGSALLPIAPMVKTVPNYVTM
jgi:hypothetical protein